MTHFVPKYSKMQHYQEQIIPMNEQEKWLFRSKVKNDAIGYVFIVAVFIGIVTLIAWNIFPIRNIDKIALVFSMFGGLIFLVIFGVFLYLFSMIFLDIKHGKKQVIEGIIIAKREHFFHNRKAGQQQKKLLYQHRRERNFCRF
jgi:hypothetical protein